MQQVTQDQLIPLIKSRLTFPKKLSFCRRTCPCQLFPLLFLSHNENETEIRFLRSNVNKELQADGKINRRTKWTIIRQTDTQTKRQTHRQSNDRYYDRERERIGPREREQDIETARKTPWNDVHIELNNTGVNKPWHSMPFQKYRVWQVQLNDPTVFVQLAPPLVQLLSSKLHSSKSESNTKAFLRGLEEWVTSKDYMNFLTFFIYF